MSRGIDKSFDHKNINDNPCLFTTDEIKRALLKLYPSMEEKEVNYHSQHIEDNDWLKVSDEENDLEDIIREQVEYVKA